MQYPSALDIAQALRDGTVTAEDLVARYLEQIREHDKFLHSFVEVYFSKALARAHAIDVSAEPRQAYAGIPIAWKDLIDIEGEVTTSGSASRQDRVAGRTATIVTRLEACGLVSLGKTHAVEFALGGWGTNPPLGTPRNPWDSQVHRVPGGSSNGSAVAVAAGLVPWAIGTDTGGSIRMPAGFCGIVGFKPTVGRISTAGVVALSRTMDTIGPLTRTVADAALLYSLMQGADPLDATTLGRAPSDVLSGLDAGVAGLRLARIPASECEGVDAAVMAAYEQSLVVLAGLGAVIVDVALPDAFASYVAHNALIVSTEAFHEFGAEALDADVPVDPVVRSRIMAGSEVSSSRYLAALAQREQHGRRFLQAMADAGAQGLLLPTTACTAIAIDAIDPDNQPSRFTRVANYLGLCALSLPNGFDGHGLPTSFQVVGLPYDEATVLRIGQALERATPWHTHRPALRPAEAVQSV
ncbi:amidase [Xylophilus sp. GOD-11R]|uniref:amidase n=1 Tax=Xylophilus sp. GOD-11R TaxID=3089814 RepID=UPI00298D1F41|nr:amidase [Xylophilus sp. GOD-11R]WPB57413.1 amidase [Xylophilus sp. GOD-11R]